MFLLDCSHAASTQDRGILLVQTDSGENLQVLEISRGGLADLHNQALEETAGLVERPLRIHDLVVEVNG